MSEELEQIEFWFDPSCPWTWISAQWILEVEKVRPVQVTFRVVSLGILNEGRDELPEDYKEMMTTMWLAVRTLMGVNERYGQEGVRTFYIALATRYFHKDEEKGNIDTVKGALADCGFDASIADRAAEGWWTEELRASHEEGMALVGEDVGSPIIHINGKALFGPVISPAPKGEEAGKLYDGVALVTAADGFFELKRSRDREPIFE